MESVDALIKMLNLSFYEARYLYQVKISIKSSTPDGSCMPHFPKSLYRLYFNRILLKYSYSMYHLLEKLCAIKKILSVIFKLFGKGTVKIKLPDNLKVHAAA